MTILIVRTLGLMLAGAWLALAVAGSDGQLAAVLWGALLGLLLSSETHHYLALRVRWLLGYIRPLLLVGVGVFWSLAVVTMVRDMSAIYRVLGGYSFVNWSFTGLSVLFWQAAYLIAGVAGALAGLWISDNLGVARAQAWRLFLGLAGLLMLLVLPVYLFASLLLRWVLPAEWADLFAFALTAAMSAAVLWALFTRRNQVEMASRRARQMMGQGVNQSRNLTRSAQGRFQQHIPGAGSSSVPTWASSSGRRVQTWSAKLHLPAPLTNNLQALSLPSLAEMEQDTPFALALAAAAAVLMLADLAGRMVVSIAFGLGMVFVLLFLIVALVIGVRLGIHYWRKRHP